MLAVARVVGAMAATVEDIQKLEAGYIKAIDRVQADNDAAVQELGTNYVANLTALETRVQKAGKLESLLAIRAERERFLAKGEIGEPDISKNIPDLRQSQQQYLDALASLPLKKARAVSNVTEQYDKALTALQENLTRDNKVEDAVRVKTWREALAKRPDVTAARFIVEEAQSKNVTASSAHGGQPQNPVAENGPPLNECAAIPPELRRGLVLWYPFEEEVKVTDRSPKGNTGAKINAKWVAEGRRGGALDFHTEGDKASYVQAKDSRSLRPPSGITIAAWVMLREAKSPSSTSDIVSKDDSDKNVSRGYVLRCRFGNTPSFVLATSGFSEVTAQPTLPYGVWTLLVGTYDGTVQRLYVNGTMGGSMVVRGKITHSTFPLKIGEGTYNPDRFLFGAVDEVMIWDRALSSGEIAAVFGL